MTLETAAILATMPRSHSLAFDDCVEYALKYPAFVGLRGNYVIAGAGVYPDKEGDWRAWAVIPPIGFPLLRWVRTEIEKFLSAFEHPVKAAVELHDGDGYVFARLLGFEELGKVECNAGRYFTLLRRA